MSNNDQANGYNTLKVSKFDHSSTTPRATPWREWVVKLRYAFESAYPLLGAKVLLPPTGSASC